MNYLCTAGLPWDFSFKKYLPNLTLQFLNNQFFKNPQGYQRPKPTVKLTWRRKVVGCKITAVNEEKSHIGINKSSEAAYTITNENEYLNLNQVYKFGTYRPFHIFYK